MKYTEALKLILFSPKSIFKDPPRWWYIKHNFTVGITWVWRAVWNILQYPFWIVIRIVFYMTAPLSALLLIWMEKESEAEVERIRKKTADGYFRHHRKIDGGGQ